MTYRQSLCWKATLSLVHSVNNLVDHCVHQHITASVSDSEDDTLLLVSQQHPLFTPIFPNTLKIGICRDAEE